MPSRPSQASFIAAPVDVLADAIHEGFQTEHGGPDDEGVGYDGREGGYQLFVYDTWDLLDEFDVTDNTSLRADLSTSIAGPWCQLNPYRSSPVEALSWGWSGFREYVARVPREDLHVPSPDADQRREEGEIPPEDMLAVLTTTIKQGELVRVLPAGTRWFRSRPHESVEHFFSAKDLGSPPPVAAKTNRMSAAGESVFYGAKSRKGVLAEIKGYTSSEYATIAAWETARPMLVIDLADLPKIPSLFDPAERHRRVNLLFLHGFAADVRKTAKAGDDEDQHYVPTQIVAEHIRELFRDAEGNRAMGVLWRSAKDGRVINCVLFVDNEGCVEQSRGWANNARAWLGLTPSSQQRGPLANTSPWVEEDQQ
ncbi:HEPN-associated N-terminal domain-containing protein [Arthrobacter sp. MDT1-48-3]